MLTTKRLPIVIIVLTVVLYLIISINFLLFAQGSVMNPDKENYVNFNKVMIIPFNEDNYFCDSDQDLAKYNKKRVQEISKMFKEGVDFNVNARILSKYDTKQMLNDPNEDVQKDLEAIYTGLAYHMEEPHHYEGCSCYMHENKDQTFYEKFESKLKIKDESREDLESEDMYNTGEYVEPANEKKYMSVSIRRPEMLTYLNEKYGTDLFVFINQFELKTNYEACLDRSIKKFTRDVLVHFSIFDKNSNLVYGDVVTVHIPSNTNDLDQIIRNNFPVVAEHLTANLPKQKPVH